MDMTINYSLDITRF